MFKNSVLPLLLLVLTLVSKSFSQTIDWQSITSIGAIRDIAIGPSGVWGGSNGGVLQLELGNSEIRKFTNTDGLTLNEVISVEIDQHGAIWFALTNGVIDRFFPGEDRWETIEDYKDQVITDLVAFGDSVYVGLDFGVSLYTIDRREVKETYVNLGLSSGGNVEKIGANSIFINGLDIWVATNKGIAQSSLTLANLQAPASWVQHTVENGLPSNFVNDVVTLDDVPYAATNSGIARFVNNRWERVGQDISSVLALEVSENEFFGDKTIVALVGNNVKWLDFALDQLQVLGTNFNDVNSVATNGSDIWIGRRDKGLARFNPNVEESWELSTTDSPASNNFKSLALDSRGRLWSANPVDNTASTPTGGVNMFNGAEWTSFTRDDGLGNNDQRVVLVDQLDRIWFGSWGGGAAIFEDINGNVNISRIDTTDGLLAGFIGNPAFVLVNGLTQDLSGNVWLLNRQAVNGNVLAVFTQNNEWVHFSTAEGLRSQFVTSIEIDGSNRVWIGTEGSGISVLDHNNTLADKSDDDFTQGLNQSEGLFSNKITALAEDLDGTMWIGSEEGVNFWFGGQVGNRFGLINDFVNTIGIDARNNKWFGTANGVSVLSNDGVSWTHYTTSNSPLVSNNVLAFAFNDETGEVWIGTANGLSRLKTPFKAPKENLEQLVGYPNPFIIKTHEYFFVENLALNTGVNFYNISGKLVKSFAAEAIEGGVVLWDGKDAQGRYVANGIYVYFAYDNADLTGTGKVAVLRP